MIGLSRRRSQSGPGRWKGCGLAAERYAHVGRSWRQKITVLPYRLTWTTGGMTAYALDCAHHKVWSCHATFSHTGDRISCPVPLLGSNYGDDAPYTNVNGTNVNAFYSKGNE